jgi:hypothetical protein
MVMDEGDPAILEALSGIAGIIEAVTAKHLDRIDELEYEAQVLRQDLAREKRSRQRDVEKLGAIGSLAYEVDARRLSDADAMAKIGGMFHGQ